MFAHREQPGVSRWLAREVGVVLGLCIGVLTACSGPLSSGGATAAQGTPAPPFELTTLDGQRITLADLKGQAVVLNFWASWCAPCRAEMPHFEKVYQEYRDRGVVFVGAAIEDDPLSAGVFVRQLGITYPVGLDEGNRIATSYGLTGLPGTMFITRDGMLARRWAGLITEGQLREFLSAIAT